MSASDGLVVATIALVVITILFEMASFTIRTWHGRPTPRNEGSSDWEEKGAPLTTREGTNSTHQEILQELKEMTHQLASLARLISDLPRANETAESFQSNKTGEGSTREVIPPAAQGWQPKEARPQALTASTSFGDEIPPLSNWEMRVLKEIASFAGPLLLTMGNPATEVALDRLSSLELIEVELDSHRSKIYKLTPRGRLILSQISSFSQ